MLIMPANLENSEVAIRLEKVNFHSSPKEGKCQRMSTELCSFCTLIKITLKILQARLQQYMNWELQDVQARFRKSRGTRDQIANIHWITEKAKEFQKSIYFCFIDNVKAILNDNLHCLRKSQQTIENS